MAKVHAVIPPEEYSTREEYHRIYARQWRDKQSAEWHEKEKERKRKQYHNNSTYYTSWQKDNVNSRLYSIAKSRAKKRGIEFNITKEDIFIPTHCPILGIELQMNQGSGAGGKKNSYSLDRIDPTKGYIKGNIQVISNLANTMKSYANPEELIAFAEWVLKEYKNG